MFYHDVQVNLAYVWYKSESQNHISERLWRFDIEQITSVKNYRKNTMNEEMFY